MQIIWMQYSIGSTGFNAWKNGHLVISRHENSLVHKNNILSFITLQSDVGKIDTQLATQVTDEMNYWKFFFGLWLMNHDLNLSQKSQEK